MSTFAALLAASYVAVQTSRTFHLQQKRDRQRDEDVRQRQAEPVAVWPGRIPHHDPLTTITFAPDSTFGEKTRGPGVAYPTRIPATIRNASEAPVYNLTVDVYIGDPNVEEPVLGGQHRVEDVKNGLAILDTIEDLEIVTPQLVESMVRVIEPRPGSPMNRRPSRSVGRSRATPASGGLPGGGSRSKTRTRGT